MSLPFSNKYLLAPLEGVNDIAFRQLCAEQGAGFTYTPQLNPLALIHNGRKAEEYARTYPQENVGMQLSGRSAETILKAWEAHKQKFSLLDINLGCPSKKIVAQGYGSALLNEKETVGKLIRDLAGSISKPLTVKMRSGFVKQEALEVAERIEKAGASAIALHARTREQKYTGKADWELIKRVKTTLSIPVIGNGDVSTPEQAKNYLDEGYCDYVMIGRAAIVNPSIFRQCLTYERTGNYEKTSKEEKHALMRRYSELWKEHALSQTLLKQHLTWMATGYEGAAKERMEIQTAKTSRDMLRTIDG